MADAGDRRPGRRRVRRWRVRDRRRSDPAHALLATDDSWRPRPGDPPASRRRRDVRPRRRAAGAVSTGTTGRAHAAVLAVDGGNSKADVALVAGDGTLLAFARGPSISHQAVGLERGMANLAALTREAAGTAATPIADVAVYCLAGADLPSDVRLLRRGIGRLGLTPELEVLNDTFAVLRAGSHRPWGIGLVCGQGINGAGVAPDGRTARFDGLGPISGDWGGGGGLGGDAIAAAVRGQDRRGPRTILERLVPEHFGHRTPLALSRALYLGRLDDVRLSSLAPVVFGAAVGGDAVARRIVDRLADELVAMASALLRRLRLTRLDPDVVLGGGIFGTDDPAFYARIETGVREVAPAAMIVRLAAVPVLGAALIGLDRRSPTGAAEPATAERLRAALAEYAG
ncbi:MAG: hypothetical protein EPO36_05930 [Chloroflexota bacterium]|nr:MAG: hypothetical protein EPO36_05930 [Chloroflexota bacterium]